MKVSKLRTVYNKAVREGLDQFSIEDNGEFYDFVTDYAKYMLEYLDGQGIKEVKFNKTGLK